MMRSAKIMITALGALLLALSVQAGGMKEIFRDDFKKNKKGWQLRNSSSAWSDVDEGHYMIQHKDESGCYMFFNHCYDLKETDDFEIEVRMRQMSGVDNYGYGFIFGFEDVNNTHAVTISSNGFMNAYAFDDGDYTDWTDWVPSAAINPMGEYNVLMLKKTGGKYEIYVNNSLVHTMSIRKFFGDQIGFVLNKEMYAQIDYISVRAEEVDVKGLKKGYKVEGELDLTFQEDFDNNKNDWSISEGEVSASEIKGGNYKLSHFRESGSYYFYKDIYFDNDEDLYIESTFLQRSGSIEGGFGLTFGMKDIDNFYSFVVSSDGHYLIFGYELDEYFTVKKWTKSDLVKSMGFVNKLGVRRSGEDMHFYVNDKLVYSCKALRFFGNTMGFRVAKNMKMDVDYLHIYGASSELNLIGDADKKYEKENLGSAINSEFEELGPLVSADGKTLWFFRDDHPDNLGGEKNDIWISQLQADGTWGDATNVDAPLNNTGHNFVISVAPDNNSLLCANSYNEDGTPDSDGVSSSNATSDGWSVPKRLDIYNEYNHNDYVNYYLSSDNKTLISSVERADTKGDLDLYVSFRKADDSFTEPKSLGAVVNSLGNESTPFLAADGRTLYFSSNGFPGYGDNDIYVTKRLDDTWTNWSEPKNLGPDINTNDWDGYYSIPASGEEAYLISYKNTIGESDIFKIKLADEAKPDPVQLVKGVVYNDETKLGMPAVISVRDLETDTEVAIAHSNASTGAFELVLPSGKSYAFYASAEGFYAVRESVDLTSLSVYEEKEVDLHLVPIVQGQNIRLNNVFFVRSKAEIKTNSFAELDNLVELLKNNPSLEIEIQGHTDNTGSKDLNMKLSEERANSVLDYLVNKGVSKGRLKAKGYGGTNPIADNRYEYTRKLNRRVEFKIIKH